MSSSDDVFRQTERIVAARPWSLESIAKVTGGRLQRVPEESTERVTVFRGSAAGPFQLVELRVTGASGNMLVLDVRPGPPILARDIRSRFGEPASIMDSDAHGTGPWYIVYSKPWGELSFGFKNDGNKELVRLVVDESGR